jgi:NADH-ubiquinone oxidoreductase chain 5
MYLLIIVLPFLGFLFSALGGRWVGGLGAGRISLTCVTFSFLLSLYAFYEVALNQAPCTISLTPWIITETTTLYWGFLFDTLTCVMLIVVTSISTLVHLYSTEYMGKDPHLPRFMSYLSFFTFFMLILVTADNFIQMFVGWEGVGLCSYLLINFWYGRIQANKAALKAMIVNRIGDFGLAIGIFAIYFYFQSFDYAIVFSLASVFATETIPFLDVNISIYDFIGFFLFVGAVGKSAQIGLHTWLPDAMEGPTPVSALIHAATMVTAGVFLLCRCSPLLQYAENISSLVTIMGGMTAFLAATTGLLQNDLKRVIAYSTCSQLGYMVFAAGLSSYSVSMFHLSNHAFFKALLFLGAGSVIHALSDEQDMRKMGGLVRILPFTYIAILVGSMALMGFPFLTGFYSKDVILEVAYGCFTLEGRFVHTLGTLAAFFTAYYSTRLLSLTFLRSVNGNRVIYEHAHESPFAMSLPLFILSIASLFVGYSTRDMFIGMGSDFWGNSLFTLPTKQYMLESEWLDSSIKMIPLIFSLSGASLAFIHYLFNFEFLFSLKNFNFGRTMYTFLNRKWLFDKVYNEWVSQSVINIAYTQTYQGMDRGLLEFLGPQGIATQFYSSAAQLATIEFAMVFHYYFSMLLGLSFLLGFLMQGLILITFIDFRLLALIILFVSIELSARKEKFFSI